MLGNKPRYVQNSRFLHSPSRITKTQSAFLRYTSASSKFLPILCIQNKSHLSSATISRASVDYFMYYQMKFSGHDFTISSSAILDE